MEKEPKVTVGRKVRIAATTILHQAAVSIADIPFAIRCLRSPKGDLLNKSGEVIAKGRIVRFSDAVQVLVTNEGETIFPNPADQLLPTD